MKILDAAHLTPAEVKFHSMWHPASGHKSGKWRVVRQFFDERGVQTLCGVNGESRLFKTFEVAYRQASKLNEDEKC